MNCSEVFQRRNYSMLMLNQAFNDDSGSWWWWTNVIGTLLFGLVGLIGNLVCFLVVYHFSFSSHSFVEYLRVLSLFDFLTLLYEFLQSLNDLSLYLFSWNLLNFRLTIICKLYDYTKYSIILLSCWTIVALTVDRFLLVCRPFATRWPNLSRRICNLHCARRIILCLVCLSLLINIPQLIYKEWVCRPAGLQHSAAALSQRLFFNQTSKRLTIEKICTCRVSPRIKSMDLKFFVIWTNYVFHLFSYTVLPAIILIASNTAILRRLNAPRKIISNQNEHLRSKLTVTLTIVSLIFLSLYIPYAIVQTVSYFVIRSYPSHCNIAVVLALHKMKRLSELLNIGALAINFFFYILAVAHYRSSAIRMLRLDHFQLFTKYITITSGTIPMHRQSGKEHTGPPTTNIPHSNSHVLKVPLYDRSSHVLISNGFESTPC